MRVAGRPETVFAYFTDPAKMVQWMQKQRWTPAPAASVGSSSSRPKRGASSWRSIPISESSSRGEQKLLATPPQSTVVEVSFTPDGEDTILQVAHRRLPAASVDFHRVGWEHFLPRLAIAAAGGDPGPDPWQVATNAEPT